MAEGLSFPGLLIPGILFLDFHPLPIGKGLLSTRIHLLFQQKFNFFIHEKCAILSNRKQSSIKFYLTNSRLSWLGCSNYNYSVGANTTTQPLGSYDIQC